MIKIELKKRIITSIILFLTIYLCIFSSPIISIIALIIISIISIFQFNNLLTKIYKKKKLIKFIFLFISFIYLILFSISSFILIQTDNKFFLYILSICVFSDIGGYIIGKRFKGKKLTRISPNKTVAGSYGSFIFSTIPAFFIYFFLYLTNEDLFLVGNNFFLINIFICLGLSLSCQVGDLFISYFKRLAKVKDTGKILPGHGGMLDRIDGILLSIPVFILFGLII